MFARALLLAIVSATSGAIASPSEKPEAENPPPVVSEKPATPTHQDRHSRPIPAPIVKPIPVSKLFAHRFEAAGLPFEWDSERGWIDRRK